MKYDKYQLAKEIYLARAANPEIAKIHKQASLDKDLEFETLQRAEINTAFKAAELFNKIARQVYIDDNTSKE